jgi:hypothetical protein
MAAQTLPLGLIDACRPDPREIERYSRLIMKHERLPKTAASDCQHEAELHLWAIRSLRAARNLRDRLADCVGGA